MSKIFGQVEKEVNEGPKKITLAEFENTHRYNDTNISINTEVSYGKFDVEPAFAAEGVDALTKQLASASNRSIIG